MPPAPTVSAVVDYEDIHSQHVVDHQQVVDPVADIAGVAVKPDERGIAVSRDEPAVQANAVRGRKEDILVLESNVSGRSVDLPVREEDEVAVEQFGLPRCESEQSHDNERQRGASYDGSAGVGHMDTVAAIPAIIQQRGCMDWPPDIIAV